MTLPWLTQLDSLRFSIAGSASTHPNPCPVPEPTQSKASPGLSSSLAVIWRVRAPWLELKSNATNTFLRETGIALNSVHKHWDVFDVPVSKGRNLKRQFDKVTERQGT